MLRACGTRCSGRTVNTTLNSRESCAQAVTNSNQGSNNYNSNQRGNKTVLDSGRSVFISKKFSNHVDTPICSGRSWINKVRFRLKPYAGKGKAIATFGLEAIDRCALVKCASTLTTLNLRFLRAYQTAKAIELVTQLITHGAKGYDCANGDERGKQGVLDGGETSAVSSLFLVRFQKCTWDRELNG